jgi:hypothetical protein
MTETNFQHNSDALQNIGVICLILLCLLAAITSGLAWHEVHLLNKKFDKQLLIYTLPVEATSRDRSGTVYLSIYLSINVIYIYIYIISLSILLLYLTIYL